ncbi:triose-phosphate isomerase [SAR86 cluster bacterium]|jgi:triosephosphate isomerase|nr:triose-phosphate isomerase [SAR86 cluster bacterium]
MSKIIAANFKMHGDVDFYSSWLKKFELPKQNTVLFAPPYLYFDCFLKDERNLLVMSQDVSDEEIGPFTSQISAKMLNEIGVEFSLIGHSETRDKMGFTNKNVFQKFLSLRANRITPIICVGESKDYRDGGKHFGFLEEQLSFYKAESKTGLIFAYEPVWSIGTGILPKSSEIFEVVEFIKSYFDFKIKVLYGGSVNASNAKDLLRIKNLDGLLVGGASLKAEEFAMIAGS